MYAKDPQLKFSQAVLSVFVVALLTAGYSFTALLCFAVRDEVFQAEGVFLYDSQPVTSRSTPLTQYYRPALTSSSLGLLTIAYNFICSRAFDWNTAAITGTVISTTSTTLYGGLLLWSHRRIVKLKEAGHSRSANLWSDQQFYSNFIQNMYPSAARSTSQPPENPISEDERINQQMALLLMKSDPGPSPDANSGTFRIDLPEDREEQLRMANSSELVGTPPTAHSDWNRNRAHSRPDSLSEEQAWQRWDRGRTVDRPSSTSGRSNHSRNLSREERRREIELGVA